MSIILVRITTVQILTLPVHLVCHIRTKINLHLPNFNNIWYFFFRHKRMLKFCDH